MTKRMVDWTVQSVKEQTVMRGGHTLPLCVLLWFKVTCCERQRLEMEGTRDDSCCDHCFFAHNDWFKNNNKDNKAEDSKHERAHTETVCARPGFCRAEQVASQQSPYGLEVQSGTQNWKDGKQGQRNEDGGRKPWKVQRMTEREER